MTTEARPRLKITYATLRADNEELHALYERGVEESRAGLGAHHRNSVAGRWAVGEVEEAAALIRFYSKTMEDNNGYDHAMDNLGDAAVHTRSVLRPHGVF